MKFSNELSNAELERLAILSEELGEAQQAIGKIMRHGYESWNPDEKVSSISNRASLQRELGDIECIIGMMVLAKDVNEEIIIERHKDKAKSIRKYLHHQ